MTPASTDRDTLLINALFGLSRWAIVYRIHLVAVYDHGVSSMRSLAICVSLLGNWLDLIDDARLLGLVTT